MLRERSCCLRRIAGGAWHQEMRFGRFINNKRVSAEKLIEGWSAPTRAAVRGLHVLAIQDSSDIKFATQEENRRGLGMVGKGNAFGVVLHAMIAVDAQTGNCLGLAGGKIWTRKGAVKIPHSQRALTEKESYRWPATAAQAKDVLAEARTITVIDDREGDFYAHWALTPAVGVHHLSRVMKDHALVKGGTLRQAVARVPVCAKAVIDVPKRLDRKARKAHLSMRYGQAEVKRPQNPGAKDLPESIKLAFVEVVEPYPPKGTAPIHWLLLTTHAVASNADACQIVAWYKQRWIIEQFFRTLKTQGLRVEDSQLATAERLVKMTVIAARAAIIVIQLVQARTAGSGLAARIAFSAEEVEALKAISKRYAGTTELQKNPHRTTSLAWAAWIVARLGGWSGYASKRPPGPITLHHGLANFQKIFAGWSLKNV